MRRRCDVCGGSGKAMGGGSIPTTCDACVDGYIGDNVDNVDETKPTKPTIDQKLDKRSKEYKQAVQNMIDETGCDESTARKMIDEAMSKL